MTSTEATAAANTEVMAAFRAEVMAAFGEEASRLSSVMLEVAAPEWARPSPCPPWTTADLLGHVLVVIAWIPDMLAAPAPDRAEVCAIDYYRPDERFSALTNDRRINLAQQQAASAGDGHALAREFDRTWRHVLDLCQQEPPDRVVRTRHGDAMLLTDFLTTRIVELGIHGLDLAAALDRQPWLTPSAALVLTDLLLGNTERDKLNELGWDELTFLRKATGRAGLTPAETRAVQQCGLRWLSLG